MHQSPHTPSVDEFTRYYEEFKNPIFNYLLYRVSFDRDVAEDLTSEVFIKAFENFHRFDRTRSFKTWIFTIAHNHLINFVTGRRQTVSLDEAIAIGADKETAKNFGEEVDTKVLTEEIFSMVSELPESQRELVVMRYVNDLSNSEIASVLRKDEGAVRTALSRAVSALRAEYTSLRKPQNSNL